MRTLSRRSAVTVCTSVVLAVAMGLSGGASEGRAEPAKPPPLDGEHLQKILKRLDESGRTRPIPPKVTEQLGATKSGQLLNVRELAFERGGFQHGFYKSTENGDDHIILAFRTPGKKWTAFLTDSRLKLTAAVTWDAGETPVRWTGEEAVQAFDNELVYWATVIDIL
jgi:hypothetical protein